MQLAGRIAVPLLLVLLTYASICITHDSGNADYRQLRDSPTLLPLPATTALRPPQSQFQCLDGNCTPQNNGIPSSTCIHAPFNDNDNDTAHVLDADGSSTPTPSPTTPFLFIALVVGSLALLWVWATDEAMILRPQFRVRGETLDDDDETETVQEKGGCRCRVCTLRMQARGLPLHDVKDNMA